MPTVIFNNFNCIRYFYFTYFSWMVFSLKTILDHVIGSLLGYLLAAQVIGDYNAMRRAYIVCIIIIIVAVFIDNYIRSISKTFDLLNTLISPVNTAIGMDKVIYYKRLNHSFLILQLLLIELTKILASIFCVIDLAIEIKDGVFLNYVLLGILIVSSLLGLLLYSTLLFHVVFFKNFYVNWLLWFGKWYLNNTVSVHVTSNPDTNILRMRFGDPEEI